MEHTGPVERADHGAKGMAMQQASTMETIVDHIRKDHRKTDEEIAELEKRVRGQRNESLDPVFVPMKKELLGHMAAEEKLLYPPLEKEMRQQIADARKEHEEIRKHLDHLSAGGGMPEDEWMRHLQMMKEGIRHHVQEEEKEILPAAERMFGRDRLLELGGEFERMEEEYK
jgi:hemerythrin-like domain-containing protein